MPETSIQRTACCTSSPRYKEHTLADTTFVDGSTLTAAAWFNDSNTLVYAVLSSVAGTNTVTAGGPSSMTAYASGQRFWFIPAVTNTGATTINITPSGGSALGAKNIFNRGVACVGGELRANVPAMITYDGTQFNLMNPQVVKGTATNDAAATGLVGEYVESVVSAVSFPTSTEYGDLTSISLTAGDWDVSLVALSDANGATVTSWAIGISTTTGNATTGLVGGSNWLVAVNPPVAGSYNAAESIPNYRMSLSGTTTVYAKFSGDYSVATPNGSGRLSARRVR